MSSDSSKKRKPKVIRTDGGPQEGKRSRPDADQDAKYYSEETEVDLRDPSKDYDLYKQTCRDLQKLMAEIQDLKSKGSKDTAAEIEERRIQSCVHFMTLKKLNRLAHIRLKKGRDQTHEAKQKVDAYHLQLQNLLYEVMHLQKEITKCLEFKSKHEEIELVSIDEFYKEAPPEISKPEITTDDPHQQTLSRLDWELEQRKRLLKRDPGSCPLRPPSEPPKPILVDGEEHEVEDIIDSRLRHNKLQYLIKCKDFAPGHREWVKASHVNAPRLIAKFHRKFPTRPGGASGKG